MKNLENVVGLQEMSLQEMEETNGGFIVSLCWLAAGILIAECLDRNAGRDFMDGWNAAK